jgi:MFS family permease
MSSAAAFSLLPASATPDAKRLVAARALRGLADGAVSVLLASHLSAIGMSPFRIGAIVTGTLVGSAALTLFFGLFGQRYSRRRVLLASSAMMLLTGLGFLGITDFWPLFLVAVAGTLNPSSGDVSLFLPTEQAVLTETIAASDRTAMFARYNLAGNFAGAFGALLSGLPSEVARRHGLDAALALRAGFVLYALVAVAVGAIYWNISTAVERPAKVQPAAGDEAPPSAPPLARSRRVVLGLAALFSIDSLGGGFVVQSMLALWLFRRFELPLATAGAVFFAASLFAALSQLVSPWLSRRIGLINTMVFTHLPSNVFLILAALMPTAPLAITFLLLRMCLSQMDVPARQSYVMAVVPPEERAAAASVTNVPRSLASATTPLLAGAMLGATPFGWPLICGGLAKIIYDLLLLRQFRALKPPEEKDAGG